MDGMIGNKGRAKMSYEYPFGVILAFIGMPFAFQYIYF